MSFKLSPEYALLGILMSGPKHGYEMHSYFSSHMDQFWRLSMSQIYALLKRMEKKGVVTSKAELQNNKPAKKIFFITPTGKEGFLNWVYSPVNHVRNLRIEFMAKLFFIKELKLKRATDIIDKQIEILQEKLHQIQPSKENTMDEFQKALHSFKIVQTSSAIEWLKECKAFFT
jgi:PadR family transcriptional regulator, regulatory protein AphA